MRTNPLPQDAPEIVEIAVADSGTISATVYAAAGSPHGVVVLHPATATPQRFYASFAAHLAANGLTTITYDYRGTGRSGPPRENASIRMRDWQSVDIPAVSDWALATYPDLPQLAVGHSLGGHGLCLSEGGEHLGGFAIVASHAGVTARIPDRMERLRVRLILNVIAPVTGRLFGYIPGATLGLGEDMPVAAMREWSGWTRLPNYFFDDPTMDAAARMARVRTPVLALGMADDPWATPEQMQVFIDHLTGTSPRLVEHSAEEVEAGEIGHHGYFRERISAALWPDLTDWLLERADARVTG